MTDAQRERLERHVLKEPPAEFHHGDCVGADKQAHYIVSNWNIRTIGHPPSSFSLRAWCECDERREFKDYHARDRDIVDETDYLIAAPKSAAEEQRSGTWYTIRYARLKGKPVFIILPDGSVVR